MRSLAVEPSIPPGAGYRREARRLRATLAGDLPRLHHRLAELCHQEDRRYQADPGNDSSSLDLTRRWIQPPCWQDLPCSDEFAGMIRRQLEEGILTYSSRLALLDRAGEMGISRFDASLMIASVQHHVESHSRRMASQADAPAGRDWFALLGAITIELVFVIFAWRLVAVG